MEWMAWNFTCWCILTTFRSNKIIVSISHGLLIFLILALFWFSETGQICGFWAFPQKMHRGNGLKFCMLMYPDHLQNWLDLGYALLIFLIMLPLWLSETGHVWCLWALPGERLGVNAEGGAEAYFQCFASSSVLSVISWHWFGTGSWTPSLWKTRAFLPYIVQ